MVASPRPALVACVLAACGGEAAGVRLVPVGDGPCGRPTDARSMLVTPLGDFRAERRPISLDGPVALADLPATTRQLAVEIVGDGGVVLAQGKTATFDLSALADGDTVAVAMVPPDDFCPAATMTEPRERPLLAAVAGGVLIAGGYAPLPLATAEWFDPLTHTVRVVELPPGLIGPRGLAGSALVSLPDGRVVLVGGPSPGFAYYEPERVRFGPPVLVSQVRAHAAAVALDDDTVLLVGGCGTLRDDGSCEPGSARADARLIDLVTGAITEGHPGLAERTGATAFLEREPDGRRAVVVVGGVDGAGVPLTTAERIDLDSGAVTVFAATGATAARTDAGTILTAFAAGGTASDVATALVPGVDVARALPAAASRVGAILITQEDGLILAVGGGAPVRYLPAASTWSLVGAAAAPTLDSGHAGLLLADGSVLVAGGRVGAAAQAGLWRFRPRLLGPYTSSLTVVPGDDESDPPLSPLDPGLVTAGPPWTLRGGTTSASYAVVGGPTGGSLRVDLTASVPGEGLGLVIGHVGPADLHQVRLVPGSEAVLERIEAGVSTTPCRGEVVPAAGINAITLDLDGRSARVAMAGLVILTCDVELLPPGRVGVAALGSGEVEVITIAVTR